jgi:Zn-dependent peptidase ImmA (M78 family)/DNA-binding XRE family transcriptional regulator
MQYFPDRLKSARKMSALSLQELSDKLNNGLSKQDLNRLETGVTKPDSKLILELSNALNVTMDYFLKEQVLELDSVEFRKLVKLPKKEQVTIIGKTTEYLERYIELESLLGIDKKLPFKFQSYKINSAEDIDKAADNLRKILNIGTDAIYNITEFLEENSIKVLPIFANKSFSGMSAQINNSLMVIVFNDIEELPLVRKRFTLIHELAHLFLDLSAFDEKTTERLCDQFANALLLSSAKLKEFFGGKRETVYISELNTIKSYYGISRPAIMYKAKSLGLISEHYFKYFMIKYNKMYLKDEVNGYKGIEKSERFKQLLLRAVAQEIISTTKAASLNNQKLGDFREQYLDISLN